MHFTTTTILALAATLTGAVPTPAGQAKSMVADVPQWTMTDFTRTCNDADTECKVQFGIDTNAGGNSTATPCSYSVTAESKASRASVANVDCGKYKVSSGWSGQFEVGFTTLSVVDSEKRLIVWPAYTDEQLVNGKAVSPDQSYAPQTLG
ncbi:hypothetical protein PpBr36_03938 [Pyricularia pennisetigena]|uniref:hypothetical protein n=1 Tax=Pyricularia pennisetigena TaxID=1578925 RepID=UPI001154E2B2|nr:hypothetical protein PpBr36_03938 [Pyricularia pennisetigena]TLS30666.1 hypothetical protein PpBr36_03938 [Pyricularia pennisetigena]